MKKVVVYNVFDSEAPDIRTVIHDKKRLILINCNQLLLLAKNGSHIISANWREIGDEADALSEVEQFYRQSHAMLFDARVQSTRNS